MPSAIHGFSIFMISSLYTLRLPEEKRDTSSRPPSGRFQEARASLRFTRTRGVKPEDNTAVLSSPTVTRGTESSPRFSVHINHTMYKGKGDIQSTLTACLRKTALFASSLPRGFRPERGRLPSRCRERYRLNYIHLFYKNFSAVHKRREGERPFSPNIRTNSVDPFRGAIRCIER